MPTGKASRLQQSTTAHTSSVPTPRAGSKAPERPQRDTDAAGSVSQGASNEGHASTGRINAARISSELARTASSTAFVQKRGVETQAERLSENMPWFGLHEIIQYQQLFMFMDKHKSGRVTKNQILATAALLGIRDEMRAAYETADTFSVGSLDFLEFMQLLSNGMRPRQPSQEVLSAFEVFAESGSKTINLGRMQEIFSALEENADSLADYQRLLVDAAGLDVDGKEYTSLVADFYHEMGGPEAAGCFGQGEAHRSVQQRPEGPLRERRRR